MEYSSSQGRYFVLDAPVVSPGVCGICGYGGTEKQYVDPRLDFEFYGSLIFCFECVSSMGNVVGCLNPVQAQALEARVEEAERQLVILRASLVNLENIGDAVSALIASGVLSSSGNLVGDSTPGADSVSAESTSAEGSDDSDADEPVDESGPDDLRDVNPADEFLSSVGL